MRLSLFTDLSEFSLRCVFISLSLIKFMLCYAMLLRDAISTKSSGDEISQVKCRIAPFYNGAIKLVYLN